MITKAFNSLDECKEYMKVLLEKTDYVCLADVKNELENYQDLVNYRQYLRNYFLRPLLTISVLEEPTPVWKTI